MFNPASFTAINNVNALDLVVMIFTTKSYADHHYAKDFINFYLSEVVDEPVKLACRKKDSTARTILSKLKGRKTILQRDKLKSCSKNNFIVLVFCDRVDRKINKICEILCRKKISFELIDSSKKGI